MRIALPAMGNRGVVRGTRRDEIVDLLGVVASSCAPDLVVLPELAVTGYPVGADVAADGALVEEVSEPLVGGPTEAALAGAAARGGFVVVAGLSERADDGRLFDTLAVIDSGGVVGAYRKIHLTPSETAFWTPGDEAVPVPTRLGTLGLAVCYDRMFPSVFGRLRRRGAELFVAASAWSTWDPDDLVDGDVWAEHGELFDRARAAENGIPFVSANWSGPKAPGASASFGGGARVVDGLGRTLPAASTSEWGSVWELDAAASAARVRHVNGGDFIERDSRSFS